MSKYDVVHLREVPPEGSGKVQNTTNTKFVVKLHHWLIKLVVGKSAVILNVHFRVGPRLEDKNIVGKINGSFKHSTLIDSCSLYCDDEKMMYITHRAEAE